MGDRPRAIPFLARLLVTALAACAIASPASAQRLRDASEIDQLQDVDIVERVGESVPLDIELVDSGGKPVTLGERFNNDKPAIIALVYYDCPVVCSLVMDRLAMSMNKLDYVVGRDYNVVVVSFDHTETTDQAFDRKQAYLSGYTHGITPETASGWTFHTADAANIRRLVGAMGWNVKRLENGEYSHPVGLTVVSQDGLISRYLYGFDYPPKQVKLSLLDASEGKIAKSLGERFMHFCYTYDPDAGAYSVQAMTIMRLGALVTVVLLAALILGLMLAERVKRSRRTPRQTDTPRARGSKMTLGTSP